MTKTQTISGSRAGIGSVVVVDAGDSKTQVISNIGAITASRPSVYTLALDAASYTITGSASNSVSNKILSVNSGSYSITGASVSYSITIGQSVEYWDSGSYLIAGNQADLTIKRVLTSTGSYSITGSSASLIKKNVLLGATASYTLVGSPASLLKHKLISVNAGSYSIESSGALLRFSGYRLNALPASFISTPHTSSKTIKLHLNAAHASFITTIPAPKLQYSFNVDPFHHSVTAGHFTAKFDKAFNPASFNASRITSVGSLHYNLRVNPKALSFNTHASTKAQAFGAKVDAARFVKEATSSGQTKYRFNVYNVTLGVSYGTATSIFRHVLTANAIEFDITNTAYFKRVYSSLEVDLHLPEEMDIQLIENSLVANYVEECIFDICLVRDDHLVVQPEDDSSLIVQLRV